MTIARRSQTFLHALAFVAGFTTVFVLLGSLAVFIGYEINQAMAYLVRLGGIVLILFGLQVAGVFSAGANYVRRAGWAANPAARGFLAFENGLSTLLYTEGRVHTRLDRRWGYASSFMMGVFFSAGWIPCIGPVLAGILMLASNSGTAAQGASLLFVYSIGLGIPFLITGAAFSAMTGWLRSMNRYLGIVSKVTGVLLIGIGFLLLLDRMTWINATIVRTMGTGLASFEPGGSAAGLTYPIAFLAGVLSFLSPCVLPLIPGYIAYLSGTAMVGSGSPADDPAGSPAGAPGPAAAQAGQPRKVGSGG